MKLFLYGSVLEKPILKYLPPSWKECIYKAYDNRIVGIDENIADRNYNLKTISKSGLKDIFILQSSFIEFIKSSKDYNLKIFAVSFNIEIDSYYDEILCDMFNECKLIESVNLIKEIMTEYDCEIQNVVFFDRSIDKMVKVSSKGVIFIDGKMKNVGNWFKSSLYLYILSDYMFPEGVENP